MTASIELDGVVSDDSKGDSLVRVFSLPLGLKSYGCIIQITFVNMCFNYSRLAPTTSLSSVCEPKRKCKSGGRARTYVYVLIFIALRASLPSSENLQETGLACDHASHLPRPSLPKSIPTNSSNKVKDKCSFNLSLFMTAKMRLAAACALALPTTFAARSGTNVANITLASCLAFLFSATVRALTSLSLPPGHIISFTISMYFKIDSSCVNALTESR